MFFELQWNQDLQKHSTNSTGRKNHLSQADLIIFAVSFLLFTVFPSLRSVYSSSHCFPIRNSWSVIPEQSPRLKHALTKNRHLKLFNSHIRCWITEQVRNEGHSVFSKDSRSSKSICKNWTVCVSVANLHTCILSLTISPTSCGTCLDAAAEKSNYKHLPGQHGWLQNCTEVSKFTEHLEPHAASDGTLYSSLVLSDSVCLQNCVFSPPPLSLLLSWAGLQCFHLVIIRFKGTLLFLHHFSGLPYFLYMWTTLMCLSRVIFVDAAEISLFKYVLTEMSQKSFVSNLKFSSVFSVLLQFMSWFSCNQQLAVKWRVICSSNCL